MIEPVIIGNATLYCGDSSEVLSTLQKVDSVITDPPYGVEGGKGGQLKNYCKADYGSYFDDSPEYIQSVVVPIIKKCINISRCCACTPGSRMLCSYPQPDDVGGFFQPASVRIGKFGFQSFQPIFYYGYYKNAGKGALATAIELMESAEKNGHPCPKPIKAWTWLVDRMTQYEWLVLDPFMGSGTTGVACMNLGRKFVGIEIEPKYFDIACRRIEDAQRQQRMFA